MKADDLHLEAIYNHAATTTVSPSPKSGNLAAEVHAQAEWGQAVRYAPRGRPVLFVRILSLATSSTSPG